MARRHGIEVEEIDLWLLGGVSRLERDAEQPSDELWFAAAGPAATAVIVVVLAIVWVAIAGELPTWGRALFVYALYINAAILVFNLLPAFPLDGGRIAHSLMWRRHGDRDRATISATRLGRGLGWGLVVVGILAAFSGQFAGLWFSLLGAFVIVAAGAEAQAAGIAHALGDRTAADLMSTPAVCLPGSVTVAEAIELGFARYLFTAFPVTDGEGRLIGIVTRRDVRELPAAEAPPRTLKAWPTGSRSLRLALSRRATALLTEPVFRHTSAGPSLSTGPVAPSASSRSRISSGDCAPKACCPGTKLRGGGLDRRYGRRPSGATQGPGDARPQVRYQRRIATTPPAAASSGDSSMPKAVTSPSCPSASATIRSHRPGRRRSRPCSTPAGSSPAAARRPSGICS